MPPLPRGLYEQIVGDALKRELDDPSSKLVAKRAPLRKAEAGNRLALHLSRLIERAVSLLPDEGRVDKAIDLARQLVELLAQEPKLSGLLDERPVAEDTVLHALTRRLPDGSIEVVEQPLTPLLDTTLLTNAPGEPRLQSQIVTEVASAERIDVIMAFVRRSGIRPFLKAFETHCNAGRSLRILTTTYTGSTERAALDELKALGAQVRVSYDVSTTRLHAKSWLFWRPAGFSTAYVGSSNLTYSAQVDGREWNVRLSGARNPDVIDKMAGVFEAYWENGDFEVFDADEFDRRTETTSKQPLSYLPPTDLRLEPFQERLLEEIEMSRDKGHHANLLAAATGTGKTVMAAVDYARLRKHLSRSRLLFVAHRKELLEQSLGTYRHAVRDNGFGELWVGEHKPTKWEHVFASIQSLSHGDLTKLAADHFDVVVVDEFHHAAAKSYAKLLAYLKPKELLGLTATPERADGLPILDYFDGRIAAELRLWDAIDQHRLVPFRYFGVHDETDLSQVAWRHGQGYDLNELTNVYTNDDQRAKLVLRQLESLGDGLENMRALGFCVGIAHARFMAKVFNRLGVPSTAVWGDSTREEREGALTQLRDGQIKVLFSVDLFNEGVDIPNVDTLLLLRPTESPTLFLQQLGRGLRKAENKHSCLVLDFVGQHRREYRFERRFQALLGGSRKHVEDQVKAGFPFLPAGCDMDLDFKAREIVLASIKASVPSQWNAKAEELKRLAAEGRGSLAGFLEDSGLELEDIYTGNRSWSDLREAAGLKLAVEGPDEEVLRRACGRLLHVDDAVRLQAYREFLGRDSPPRVEDTTSADTRLAHMLIGSVTDRAVTKEQPLKDAANLLWEHPQVRAELLELFEVLATRTSHRQHALSTHPGVPLQVHARYTRREILAAFDPQPTAKIAPWQTGIRWAETERTDLLAFTLDKTGGQFSPTTRYRDYAISTDLIHWESQSVTRADSKTGQRYQHHAANGSSIMLFAREHQDERAFWFLGPATYVRHEGERPMAITWKLKHALPGDLFASFAAAVA